MKPVPKLEGAGCPKVPEVDILAGFAPSNPPALAVLGVIVEFWPKGAGAVELDPPKIFPAGVALIPPGLFCPNNPVFAELTLAPKSPLLEFVVLLFAPNKLPLVAVVEVADGALLVAPHKPGAAEDAPPKRLGPFPFTAVFFVEVGM